MERPAFYAQPQFMTIIWILENQLALSPTWRFPCLDRESEELQISSLKVISHIRYILASEPKFGVTYDAKGGQIQWVFLQAKPRFSVPPSTSLVGETSGKNYGLRVYSHDQMSIRSTQYIIKIQLVWWPLRLDGCAHGNWRKFGPMPLP